MSFLAEPDLLTAIYPEQLDAITREDDAAAQFAMDTAEEEMKGYLSPKYDVATIFGKVGAARNKLLVTFCRDIAVFHLINIANPGIDYPSKKDLYERAVRWCEQVQSGKINPPDLELDEEDETDNEILLTSNNRRNNHY
jgi:phage gp36-like protein